MSQADIMDLQSQVKDLQLRLRECRLKHKQEKDQLRIRFDLQQIRLEKDLHLKTQFKIKGFRDDVRHQVEDIMKDLSSILEKERDNETKKELQLVQSKLEGMSKNMKLNKDDSQFLLFQDLNQDTQMIGSVFNNLEDDEDQALLQELESNKEIRGKNFQIRKTSEHQTDKRKLQEDTLNLTNYSDQKIKVPMPQSKESLQAASESASVNQAMIYSEQSFPHALSSVSISRKEETSTLPLTKQQLLKKQLEQQISQMDSKMTLSEKERLLCNIYSKNFLDRAGLQDVKAEDVLRTFTNSIEPSMRSLARQNLPTEEIGNLSPIRNMKEKKEMVNEIQKIAKEIKRIPTQDFKTEEFLKTSQNQSFDEEDSLLQELGKLSSKEHVSNPYQVKPISKQNNQNEIEGKQLQDYIDVPFSRVISSIDSLNKINQGSKGEIRIKQNTVGQQSKGISNQETAKAELNEQMIHSQSRLEDSKNMVLNQNSSGQLIDMKSPFQVQSQSMLDSNINDSDINFTNQQNNQSMIQNKLNIKKNQIRFNNLNNFVSQSRRQQDSFQHSQQQNNQAQHQQNYHPNSHQVNNNFIELNNSVIILQKNSRETSPLTSQIMENLVVDRPFTEMRKIKQSKSNNYSQIDYYNNNKNFNSNPTSKFNMYQPQPISQNQQNYLNNYNFKEDQNQKHTQPIKNSIQSNQMQRRLQNVSVQEQQNYQFQSHLKVQSPNMSLNSSAKRAQSSLNGSKVMDLSNFSPYIHSQKQQQQPQQQTQKPIKMLKLGKKNGNQLQQKVLNLSNNPSTNQELGQSQIKQSPQNQSQLQQQQSAIRVIKKGMLNKIITQNSNANISASKIKLTDLSGGGQKMNVLAKATNKINRIQPQ